MEEAYKVKAHERFTYLMQDLPDYTQFKIRNIEVTDIFDSEPGNAYEFTAEMQFTLDTDDYHWSDNLIETGSWLCANCIEWTDTTNGPEHSYVIISILLEVSHD